MRKFTALSALYGRWRKSMTIDDVTRLVQQTTGNPQLARQFVQMAEGALTFYRDKPSR
jgi:hypothetical protein